VRGCILGQALGDALGAPFEFQKTEVVRERTGVQWIDRLWELRLKPSPHGPWRAPAPPGTGTDDVRYNWLFLELAGELGRMPLAQELAARYLEVYERPEEFFRGYPELARQQFETWEGVCRGCLGQESVHYPGVPPQVLRERSVGLNYPTMAGLLTLPSAGLLFAGNPEEAYSAAFAAAFFDVGYAREATALFAAAVSLGMDGHAPPEVAKQTLAMDPLLLGGYFGGPFVRENLPRVLEETQGRIGQELAEFLSERLEGFRVFDPFRALAIAFAALLAHGDDPFQALLVAANQRDAPLDRYADIDCYAGITGALVGAVHGAEVFPQALLAQVVESNREVYGLDLEKSAARFCRVISGAGKRE
jgi:ADP-ribosylglycohydrolase